MTKEMVRLYRGVCLSAQELLKFEEMLSTKGIDLDPAQSYSEAKFQLSPKPLEVLLHKSRLSSDDVFPSQLVKHERGMKRVYEGAFPITFACGGRVGAEYYALDHNKSPSEGRNLSRVVVFECPIENMWVDGRDFLYTTFMYQKFDELNVKTLKKLFGKAIEKYIARAKIGGPRDVREVFPYCDLAIQDPMIISAHAKNQLLIGGRYNTVYESAFFVRVPIPPEQILEVYTPGPRKFKPDVTIEQFRRFES